MYKLTNIPDKNSKESKIMRKKKCMRKINLYFASRGYCNNVI